MANPNRARRPRPANLVVVTSTARPSLQQMRMDKFDPSRRVGIAERRVPVARLGAAVAALARNPDASFISVSGIGEGEIRHLRGGSRLDFASPFGGSVIDPEDLQEFFEDERGALTFVAARSNRDG